MLDFKEIQSKTKYKIYIQGQCKILTFEESKIYKKESIENVELVDYMNQPKEIQPFWKAYNYAKTELGMELNSISEFYAEWSKNPNAFEPDHKPVKNKLLTILESIKDYQNVRIENYDGKQLGEHHCGNFIEALKVLDVDFDVIQTSECDGDTLEIIIQEDNAETLNEFNYKANAISLDHDLFFGDGKYYKN